MPPKKAASKSAVKPGDKSQKELSVKTDDKKTALPSEPQAYTNEYTNKLKDTLKKQLQSTKGFPEKLKSVGCE